MRCAVLAVLAGCGRFGFDPLTATDAPFDDADVDASVVVPDIGTLWVTTSESRGGAALWVVRPLDNDGFSAPCPEVSASDDYLYLLGHPTLSYAYAVKDDLRGLGIGCGVVTEVVGIAPVSRRPDQRAVLDPTASVGFVTFDGPISRGLYRFTVALDGVPTGSTSGDAPAVGSPIALDGAGALYVGGQNEFGGYTLGGGLALPGVYAPAATCMQPIDVMTSGAFVLSFCRDSPQIGRNMRDPASPVQVAPAPGTLGPFDAARPLLGDRAVAARISPPQLQVLLLGAGTPTLAPMDGPILPARVQDLAVAADGGVVIATWLTGASSSAIGAWVVVGDVLVPLGTATTTTLVSAATITPEG